LNLRVISISARPPRWFCKRPVKIYRKAVLATFVLSILFFASLGWHVSAAPTVMEVNPSSFSISVGDSFRSNVSVVDVSNLAGWEFKLYFKRSILQCSAIEEGPFLRNVGSTFTIFQINNTYNATHGRVFPACTLLGFDVSASGSGVLASIIFQAVGPGSTILDLVDTKLAARGDPPPAIPHTSTDGIAYVSSVVEVAVSPSYTSFPLNTVFKINVTVSSVYDLVYWQCGMAFNPSVLACLNVTEGPFLKSGGDTTWQPGTVDNIQGIIAPYGSTLNAATGVLGSGVLEYITFRVKSAGTSPLTLQDVILLNSTYQKIKPIILLHGSFELQPQQPEPPVAYYTYEPTTPYAGYLVTFNASQSDPVGGTIVSYAWDFNDGSHGSGMICTHVFGVGNFNVSLNVTDSEGLWNVFSRIVAVSPAPSEYYLDAYTQRDGKGLNEPSDAFAPSELVLVSAFLAYNGSAVMGKAVTFHLYYPNGSLMMSRVTQTDDKGIAFIVYTIPSSPPFGIYTVNASHSILSRLVSDKLEFRVGWLIETLQAPACNRFGVTKDGFGIGEPLYFLVKMQNIRFRSTPVSFTVCGFDEQYHPIASNKITMVAPPNETTFIFYAGVIPSNALVGDAIAYINAFVYIGGSAFCPEKDSQFRIKLPIPDVAVVSVQASPSTVRVGKSVEITVTVLNDYYRPQSFNLTIFANTTNIRKFSIVDLTPYAFTNCTYVWDTYTFSQGNYRISAQASVVPGEIDTADNTLANGFVRIVPKTGPVHDISITGVKISKTIASSLNVVQINVTVQNQGDYTEIFDVSIFANSSFVQKSTTIVLSPGSSIEVTFTWSIAGWSLGKYNVIAYASEVPGEDDVLDNSAYLSLRVAKPGDVNGDGKINVLDLIVVARAIGTRPGDAKWDPNADVKEDKRINVLDLILVAHYLGT